MEIYINKIKSPIAHFHFDYFFFSQTDAQGDLKYCEEA